MRLSIKSLGIVSALLWGGGVFLCGVCESGERCLWRGIPESSELNLSRLPCIAHIGRRISRQRLRGG